MALQKLNYKLTVYFDTGFNGVDIPKSASVLNSGNIRKKVYNDVYYLREDIDNPVIVVNDNYHELADVDYACLTAYSSGQGMRNDTPVNMYYFATPTAVTGGVTALGLELDALLTMGGVDNITFISGWQTRGHLSADEDGVFENIASEGFIPNKPLVVVNDDVIPIDNQSPYKPDADVDLITSNINLSITTEDIQSNKMQAYVCTPQDEAVDGQVILPKLHSVDMPTTYNLNFYDPSIDDFNSRVLEIENMAAYPIDFEDEVTIEEQTFHYSVRKNLEYLLSCGQLQLQNAYRIPKEYIGQMVVRNSERLFVFNNGSVESISGYPEKKVLENYPFEYAVQNYTVKNKKAFNMFRTITIYNPASGNSDTKTIGELKYKDATAITIALWADLTSTGKPFCKFLTDEAINSPFINFIEGAQWCNTQVLVEGASGSLWSALALGNQKYAMETQGILLREQIGQENIDSAIKNGTLSNTDAGMMGRRNRLGLYQMGMGQIGNIGDAVSTIRDSVNGAGSAASAGIALMQLTAQVGTANEARRLSEEGSYLDAIASARALESAARNANLDYFSNNALKAPQVLFTPSPNLAMYGENKFYIYETRMQDSDIIELDKYFQRYGYNGLHRPLTTECFDKRQYFSYVEAVDVNIKSNLYSIGRRVRNKAISMLNGGVRVWKTKPDPALVDNNV